ncbi:fibrinogen and fibronectin, partial [Reticulomyxa filosa]
MSKTYQALMAQNLKSINMAKQRANRKKDEQQSKSVYGKVDQIEGEGEDDNDEGRLERQETKKNEEKEKKELEKKTPQLQNQNQNQNQNQKQSPSQGPNQLSAHRKSNKMFVSQSPSSRLLKNKSGCVSPPNRTLPSVPQTVPSQRCLPENKRAVKKNQPLNC